MILLEKRAAISVFYYLMAVDGTVTQDEVDCFDSIGKELDPDAFYEYRNAAIEECERQLNNLIDDEDYYEVVLEGADKALACQIDDIENGLSLRHLIWNMLVIAFSNAEYSSAERRLIKHIVRTTGLDHSVFLEMEQIMKTNVSVEQELIWFNQSERPYSEIRPIIEELEKRKQTILLCAQQLIEDELYTPVEKVALPGNGIYVGAKKTIGKIGSSVASATSELGKKTKGLFAGIKTSIHTSREEK